MLPADATRTVDVTLREWAVVPAWSSVKTGSVTFEVTNAGPEDEHESVIIRTDLGARGTPLGPDSAPDEEGEGVELIGEVEESDLGSTESATFELAPGTYVFPCNLVEEDAGRTEVHRQPGMSIDFTVEWGQRGTASGPRRIPGGSGSVRRAPRAPRSPRAAPAAPAAP